MWLDGDEGYIVLQGGANGRALQAQMSRLIQRYEKKGLVLFVLRTTVLTTVYLKVHEQSLTPLWRAWEYKPVSPLQGGASGSAGVGAGSAAIELRADDTALRQPESEEHKKQRADCENKSRQSYTTGSRSASSRRSCAE